MSAPDCKILVVDDNEAGLYVKTHILGSAGYHVFSAHTGQSALSLVEELRPDMAVLDVRLPDISGYDLCRRIKLMQPSILVLQTSATFVRGQDRAAGLDSGADAYLNEPLEPEELLAAVRALLRMRNAESELRQLNNTLEQRVIDRTRELAEANEKISREISDRLKAEEALRQIQKMEAVGQLTGGIAHDFNNLLTVIYGGLETVKRRMQTDDERLTRAIDHCMTAARHAASLTRRLLAFARRQPLDPKPAQVNRLAMGMAEMLRRTLGESTTMQYQLAEDIWPVEVDVNQLESSLLNLAVNARDAMPDGGILRIETANTQVKANESRNMDLAPGDYVTIAVSDNGQGMPKEVLDKVFEPFFTTKPSGQGTGLGLSQVYGFVKQSGGGVHISSEPGIGTSVKIYLPKFGGSAEVELRTRIETAPAAAGHETVLVVEDNQNVRAHSADILRELGYRVLEAGDADAALAVLRKHQDVSLLFTDIGLPGALSGPQLAQEAGRILPNLKVLYVSGYARDAMLDDGRLQTGVALIDKPFTFTDLANKLREVLHR